MSFYEKFCHLCELKGVSPSKAATDMRMSKSIVTKWKQNIDSNPTTDTVKKLAAYFDLSPNEIIGDVSYTSTEISADLARYINMIKYRPDLKELLDTVEYYSSSDVYTSIRVILAMRFKEQQR